ncbi:MAG TPA: transporter [Candidatus Solibacter sp.]|nr:transporter [Candidatus Solibacter sp.]
MRLLLCVITGLAGLFAASPLAAQLPFYTDDPAVTDPGVLHFEFFNEFDGLQSSQFPDLRQNTANFKINYGLKHNLELDLDFPYLNIYRAAGTASATGFGDTDLGIKWNFHKASAGSWVPALGASFYTEFPTGDEQNGLGSGLSDYWLNMIAQKPFTEKIRMNANFGFLFAGNTSTGAIGVQTKRGHVFTGGLSLLRDFTPRLSLGIEGYAGFADTSGLGRTQLQGLVGGEYMIRDGFSFTFGLLGGKYEASPRVGGQLGFSVDLPMVKNRRQTARLVF